MINNLNIIKDDEKPWYNEGLSFKCTECGQCCTGAPGYVWVSVPEVKAMAEHLGISVKEFSDKYVRTVDGRLSLVEDDSNFDCVFLKDRKCQIYSVRPKQCRTFPWWPQNLSSKKAWDEAAKFCEGINNQASTVPYKTIKEQLNIQNGVADASSDN